MFGNLCESKDCIIVGDYRFKGLPVLQIRPISSDTFTVGPCTEKRTSFSRERDVRIENLSRSVGGRVTHTMTANTENSLYNAKLFVRSIAISSTVVSNTVKYELSAFTTFENPNRSCIVVENVPRDSQSQSFFRRVPRNDRTTIRIFFV